MNFLEMAGAGVLILLVLFVVYAVVLDLTRRYVVLAVKEASQEYFKVRLAHYNDCLKRENFDHKLN